MSRFWSHLVSTLDPYVPGEQPRIQNLIKLNTNEHPYGPSPKVIAAIAQASDASLRLYPDPTSLALRQAIAQRESLDAEQVFVGNGSDEVLAHAFQALLKQERPLLFPDITYSFYPVYCGLYQIAHRTIALGAALAIRPEDYLHGDAGGIIFPNPNAPTGRGLALDAVERVVAGNPDVVVVIDEAYVDFGGQSATVLIDRYPNLLVVQTMSKSRSLAGLRVGFAMGHPDLIQGLDRVKNSFNSYPLDRLAQAGGVAAIEDEAYFQQTRHAVMQTRDGLVEGLGALGFDVLPSLANFVFASHPRRPAEEIAAALRERGVIVRHFRRPRISNYLRITVGTDQQCGQLVAACAEILA